VHAPSILINIFKYNGTVNIDDFTNITEIPIRLNGNVRIKQRQTKPFLKGPVPLDWLQAAGRLPGQCLQVGIVLWHEAGIAGSRAVQFRPSKALKFGMHRDTARRALQRLEIARLIAIHHKPGRCLDVQILDAPPLAASPDLAEPIIGKN